MVIYYIIDFGHVCYIQYSFAIVDDERGSVFGCGCFFFFQAEDGIRDLVRSRGLGDVYKRQTWHPAQARRQGWRGNMRPTTQDRSGRHVGLGPRLSLIHI